MAPSSWQREKDVFQAALTRAPESRGAYLDEACGGDSELRSDVERLLAAHDQAGAFLSSPIGLDIPTGEEADEPRPAPQRIGPYRILDTIAHGGMGTVYRAVRDDDTFRKTVALKLVRGGRHSEYFERRFRQEREILALLQHPNIATVLDGGTTEAGQPYLVMEHVEGQPITEFCTARALGTRERLALFRAVCGAVHYAHQNLVVHRDIKPANVLVDPRGMPKLLDFGIAKLLASGVDPEVAPTATVLPVMTPEYASPEQVRGQPVTTASDVYSLGVLLYELLAGRRPYEVNTDSLEAIVRTVCETQPKPPSDAAGERPATTVPAGKAFPHPSELRGDLDTIVLTALRKEPERRYPSVHELSEDLRRHLEGLPVRARADAIGYRAGKFVGRHRAAVTASALVMLSLVAGIFATLRQQRIAEAQRARAERRFADVRKLANSFLFEFEHAIRDLPGSTPARQLVVKKALEYLDGLVQEASGDRVLQAELATAYQKVGDVQGSPYGANLGDTAGAVASYRKEVAIREVLAAPQRDREAARELVTAYRRLGLLEHEAGETQAGVEHLDQALRLGERLLAEDATDGKARRAVAHSHDGAGELALHTGDQARAEDHQRRALAIWEAEVQASPEDQEALRSLHLIHGDLARTLRVTGRLPEAAEHYGRALDTAQRRLALAPKDLVARRDEANGHTNLAIALYRQGRLDEAAAEIAKSLAFYEEMLRADPRNTQAQRDVSWDLSFMAELETARGNLEEALAHQRRSLAIDQAVADAFGGSFQARKELAESWSSLTDLLHRLRRFDAALDASRQSVTLFEEVARANPEHARVRQLMAIQYERHAAVLEALAGRDTHTAADPGTWRREACQAYGRSAELWEELSSKGAAIDSENLSRHEQVRKAAGRCGTLLRRR